VTSWPEVLDALEADLDAMREVVDDLDRTIEGTAFVAPAGLGPMPAELAPKAVELQLRYEALIARAMQERGRLGHELASLPRPVAEPRGRARVDFTS
jgi:hypothetical protein